MKKGFAYLGAVLGAGLAASCERPEPRPSPLLQIVDSVQLIETDSQFIGLPVGLATSSDGSYFIGDVQQGTVLRYAPSGRYLGRIGGPGEGPGEFRMPPAALQAEGDSLYVLVGAELHIFNSRTGVHAATRTLPTGFVHAFTVRQGRVLFRHVSPELRSTVGILALASDSLEAGGPFPSVLGQSPIIAQGLSEVVATGGGGDTLFVATRVSDFMYLGPTAGPFDSIEVAVLSRQGARPDLIEKIAADPENAGADVYTPSLPTLLERLSSGELIYVVSDLRLVDRRFTGELYVSAIDLEDRTACPDARVPVVSDPRPAISIRGDTLVVLSQEVRGTESEVWIRKYLVSTAGCEWVPG
jgi:hypothetical protein